MRHKSQMISFGFVIVLIGAVNVAGGGFLYGQKGGVEIEPFFLETFET